MDIRKKRFTLNATFLALLTLNAEVAKATNCPAIIRGTDLAAIVCDFSASSSVTVENGGEVGGIAMNGRTGDQITINAGGFLGGITTTGINIAHSILLNGLINNGTISSDGAGVLVTHSIIGSISNQGTISSSSSTGVQVNNSTINGSISNSGTITGGGNSDAIVVGFNSAVNGDIINSGTINSGKSGNGILVGFTSNVTGSILNSGRINANHTGILAFVLGDIGQDILNSGSIIAGDYGIRVTNESVVGGDISNSGLIDAGNGGIVVRSASTARNISNSGTIIGINTGIAVTSTSSVSGGISNSGTIQGGINAINIDANSSVGGINIIGQHARVIGAVNAENTDFNVTSGAIFTSEGTFDVNNFNIASNAVFNMANAIIVHGALNNAGTLAIGNTSQTLAGNYTQNTGGTLQIGATSAASHGELVVSGRADLSQSGNINVQVANNSSIKQGDILSNVISGGSLLGPTGGFNITDNSFLWKFIADPTSSGVNLTATIDSNAYSACQGQYCQGAANAIIGQVAEGNSAFGPYAAIPTESAFKTAAGQASPELTNANIQALQFITNSVTDSVPMWKVLHGKAAENVLPYQTNQVWVRPYGGSMSQGENNSVPGFNATAYGVVMGRDIALADDGVFGGALAVGQDTMRGKSELSTQSMDSDAYQGILYGSRKLPHNLYFAGQGLLGYQNNNTKRSIPTYSSTAKGSFGSWFTNLNAELGWNAYALNQRLVLTPELEASYLFVTQGGYKESGSTMDLSVDPNHNSTLTLGAYGNGAYRLVTSGTEQDLTLTGYAGLARNILNSTPQVTATFLAGGPSFSTYGAQFNQFVFRGGLGLNFSNPDKPLRVSLNYDLQAGNNAYNGVGSLTVAYKLQ